MRLQQPHRHHGHMRVHCSQAGAIARPHSSSSVTERKGESWARQSRTQSLRRWPPLFFAREQFPPGNSGRGPTCFLFARAHAVPRYLAAAVASARFSVGPQADALEIRDLSDRRKNSLEAETRHPLLFCLKGERSWVGKSKQHSLLPLLLPSYVPGQSQPGNCRGSQELLEFAADVAAPPNHAAAHAPACL